MAQTGTGEYRYELIRDFLKLPAGQTFGLVSRVGADAQDRIYVFQRKDPPVVVFDRDGKYLGAWGSGEVTDPHGLKIVGDTVYIGDASGALHAIGTVDMRPTPPLNLLGAAVATLGVCAAAFANPSDMQQLSATVLHELSHRLDNTNDKKYCPESEGWCSTLNTKAAIDNADSYAQFAREIFNASM